MNKEQSADDHHESDSSVKNMLNSTISMSYPDVVVHAYRTGVSEAFKTIEAALVNTIII